MSENVTEVPLILTELGITVVLKDIEVDQDDPCVLNIEYDYDENCGVEKEKIDAELSRVVIEALERSVENMEKEEK